MRRMTSLNCPVCCVGGGSQKLGKYMQRVPCNEVLQSRAVDKCPVDHLLCRRVWVPIHQRVDIVYTMPMYAQKQTSDTAYAHVGADICSLPAAPAMLGGVSLVAPQVGCIAASEQATHVRT